MEITRKDVGYTIYSRLEESLRSWIAGMLETTFGDDWHSYVPGGISGKAQELLSLSSIEEVEDPNVLLEELNIPDLAEIVCYKKGLLSYFPKDRMALETFRESMHKIYHIRCKIAHVKRTFSAIDLDALVDMANDFLPLLESSGTSLREAVECIKTNPDKVVVRIPAAFFTDGEETPFVHPTNLPPSDYDPDGGFIGRKDDIKNIEKLVLGDLHRVITVSGAGGVGKTALVHHVCQKILNRRDLRFDGVVWVSAKEERLTASGIEAIEPTFHNYQDLMDGILETFGWTDEINGSSKEKEESVQVILQAGEKGILLVVDNLETIKDERVVEFIKDFPPPSKVLITSRLGLGEVERRYPLREMKKKDAITLLRSVAKEKQVTDLCKLPDDTLGTYVEKMAKYPLAIKWVVGQVAVGKDMDVTCCDLTSSGGDIGRFCFEHILSLLDENSKMVLFALAVYHRPMVRGVLSHVANLSIEDLDAALRELTLASLVVPSQSKSSDSLIETNYTLLPLTRNYLQSKLQAKSESYRAISNRIEMVRNLIEEADRAGKEYRYSLRDMGAQSEAEKVAATWANTAYQKYQAGDYDGACQAYRRSAQIAPKFPAIYKNWAMMESDAGFHEKADSLMKKAIDLDPCDSRLWFAWGLIEKRRQRFDRSSQYLNKARELSPDEAPILGALGEVEKRRGNFETAQDLLSQALKMGGTVKSSRRNEVICCTLMADNLKRWAEVLNNDKRLDECIEKLREAHHFATKAAKLDKDDHRAQDALKQVNLDMGLRLLHSEGFAKGKPFLQEAVKGAPKRAKEKKIAQVACYHLATHLLAEGHLDEAKRYYALGRRSVLGRGKYDTLLRGMEAEFSGKRTQGVLYHVVMGKGYGFLESEEHPGQSIFVHLSSIQPELTNDEFAAAKGGTLSFVVKQTDKGPQAVAVRGVKNRPD